MRLVGWVALAVFCQSGLTWAADPCPHPYFPLREGMALTYRAGKSDVGIKFAGVSKTDGGESGRVEVAIKGRQGAAEAYCSAEGVRTEMGGLEGVALKAAGLDAKVLSASGMALPPYGELSLGKKWVNTISLELAAPGGMTLPGGIKPVMTTTFEKEAEVVGFEKITLGEKEHQAMRVKNRTTAISGRGGATRRTVESDMWFVEGLGLVRLMTGKSVDLELVKVEGAGAHPPTDTPGAPK